MSDNPAELSHPAEDEKMMTMEEEEVVSAAHAPAPNAPLPSAEGGESAPAPSMEDGQDKHEETVTVKVEPAPADEQPSVSSPSSAPTPIAAAPAMQRQSSAHDQMPEDTKVDVKMEDAPTTSSTSPSSTTPNANASAGAAPAATVPTRRSQRQAAALANAKTKTQSQPQTKKTKAKAKREYCVCRGPDDGSPMVNCGVCRDWFHFKCVDLTEEKAEDISVYVCPPCQTKTGRPITYEWEGSDALEPVSDDENAVIPVPPSTDDEGGGVASTAGGGGGGGSETDEKTKSAIASSALPITRIESDSEEDGSGDDYVDDRDAHGKGGKKRKSRRLSVSSASSSSSIDDEGTGGGRKRSRTATTTTTTATSLSKAPRSSSATMGRRGTSMSASPAPPILPPASTGASGGIKRKTSSAAPGPSASTSSHKRRKSSAGMTAEDDATRSYCLKKLQEVFVTIFLKYPHLPQRREVAATNEDGMQVEGEEKTGGKEGGAEANEEKKDVEETGERVERDPATLTDEERETLTKEAHAFATELERCVFEACAEPDKQGDMAVSAKYKERFRMLQFNLSKPDRVVIHKRIASYHVTPLAISRMSSTELANEIQQEFIKAAAEQALAHSTLLEKTTAPRAKITHKGLQDIEDVNGDIVGTRELEKERERELEAEERRERERIARLKAAEEQEQQRTAVALAAAAAVQSQSGEVPSWGGPPPLPSKPLFIHTQSDFAMDGAQELNLTDLINIDEEPSSSDAGHGAPASASPVALSPSVASGPSPFAVPMAKPTLPHHRTSSFNLNALWNASTAKEDKLSTKDREDKDEDGDDAMEMSPPPEDERVSEDSTSLQIDATNEALDDRDFDMFLEKEGAEGAETKMEEDNSPEAIRAKFEALPQVWSGKISMPTDSAAPQETLITARQVGGRVLEADSHLWRTLFPQELLRIDGRVQVESSVKFLLQMRLNSSKELIVAAFLPNTPESQTGFDTLSNFLISKNRHGLIFPWGTRPKEHHPGKELYIIPLKATDALPEFMEMLDNMKIPSTRSYDLLVGVWVLNKGKLVAPPQPPPPAPVTALSSLLPQLSSLSSSLPVLPQSQSPPVVPSAAPPIINPSALAAEVASLTPEQIQLMIRTLSSTPLGATLQPSSLTPQFPTSTPTPPTPGPPSLWPNTPPTTAAPPPQIPYLGAYPPTPGLSQQYSPGIPPGSSPQAPYQPGGPGLMQASSSPHPPSQSFHSPPSQSWDRPSMGGNFERRDDHDRNFGYERDNRGSPGGGARGGWRGRGRGRGRHGGGGGGGSGGWGRDHESKRQQDSGWPRKPSGHGQRGDGPNSGWQ